MTYWPEPIGHSIMPKKMAATACVGQRAGELNGGRLQELEILLNHSEQLVRIIVTKCDNGVAFAFPIASASVRRVCVPKTLSELMT